MTHRFTGFKKETIIYLKNLKKNNNKTWFEEHRSDYTSFLLEPMQGLVVDLTSTMLKIDPEFEIRPMTDKTISRIYRDIRFSKDKSPYKSNMWITFKKRIKDWKNSPAYFFELTPEFYRYGMGYYCASRETMDNFRTQIIHENLEFKSVISSFDSQKTFVLEGEEYKRIHNESIPEKYMRWYQKKNFYLVCNRKIDDLLFGSKLKDKLIKDFTSLEIFYKYLLKLKSW